MEAVLLSPSQYHPNNRGSHNRRFNPQTAARLQKLYRCNKKKCIRSILEDNSPKCEIPLKDLEEYFSAKPPQSPSENAPLQQQQTLLHADDLTYPIEMDEIEQQLRRLPSNSSPGSDGVPYETWKTVEGSKITLERIFTTCLFNKKIPQSWKRSSTILIYKKGDRKEPSNWRPISLQSTIYKIYTAILARRLAEWAICEKKISPAQKGFLPYEGCFEHSFMLRSVLEDSKRLRKNARIVFLDLENAFGSVPHKKNVGGDAPIWSTS